MFFELIATFTVGFGVAGIAMLVRRLSRGALPRWLTPVAAGLAMIAFTIWSEYSWYGRTVAGLPEGVEVATAVSDRQVYRPWTYLFPLTDRFIAVDTAGARTNPELPGQKLVDVYVMGRWSPNQRLSVVVDCETGRRAELVEGVEMDASGRLPDAAWRSVEADDPLVATACGPGIG